MKTFILFGIGVLLASSGGFLAVMDYVDGSWPRVSASVIGSRIIDDEEAPIVEYDALGTKFQVRSSDSPLVGSFQVGEKLLVAYNPNSPGEAKIVPSGIVALMQWLLIVTGLLLIVGGIIMRSRTRHDSVDADEPDMLDNPDHQV